MIRVCCAAVAVLWIFLGVAKLAAPGDFDTYIRQTYPILAPARAEVVAAVVTAELVLGIVGVTGAVLARRLCRLVLLVTLFAATAAVIDAVVHREAPLSCGCFGGVAQGTVHLRLAIGGLLMLLSALPWTMSAQDCGGRDDAKGA